jgi:hypothetical protein
MKARATPLIDDEKRTFLSVRFPDRQTFTF